MYDYFISLNIVNIDDLAEEGSPDLEVLRGVKANS